MPCLRCHGPLLTEQVETLEGRLCLLRCIVCGYRDDPLMREHKRHRPEPHRQVPHKPVRGRRRTP